MLVKAYDLPDKPGEGFVVCFVPEGQFKPYRAEHADKQWYIRAGDNFVVMTPSVLRSMFYPHLTARFRVRADLLWHRRSLPNGNIRAEVTGIFQLKNDGPATGNSPFIQVEVDIKDTLNTFKSLPEPGWTIDPPPHWSIESRRPVHPGAAVRFIRFEWSIATKPLADEPLVYVPIDPMAAFTIRVHAENQPVQVFKVVFGEDAFLSGNATTVEASPIE